jgi:ABC-type Fe3+ transport system substrate-binding protein
MKRSALIILFFVVLGAPFALRFVIGVSGSAPNAKNSVTLIVLTPHAESIRREFAEAFSSWHHEKFGQTVEMDYRALSANDIVRYLRSGKESIYQKLGTFNVDLVWGGGDFLHDVELKREGVLQPLDLPAEVLAAAYPRGELGGLALYDRSTPPVWFGTALSSFGIVYNKDVLKHLGLPEPRRWEDLKDPRYRTWLVLTDPTKSGIARSVFMVMVERAMEDAKLIGRSEDVGWAQGMGSIRQIASNARIFNDSGTSVASWVTSGDVAAGLAIDFQARAQIEAVGEDRLGYVEPVGATSINPEPVAMVKGAPHREVAQRFIEFLLSDRGQRLWITRAGAPNGPRLNSLRRLPIVPSVYANPVNFTESVNPFGAAENFNSSAARKKTLTVIPDLIEISCIDLLEQLRETRAKILSSPDAAALDLALGMFPINQRQALELAQAWSKMTPLERLEERRQLQSKFRAEYEHLNQAAQARQATAYVQ